METTASLSQITCDELSFCFVQYGCSITDLCVGNVCPEITCCNDYRWTDVNLLTQVNLDQSPHLRESAAVTYMLKYEYPPLYTSHHFCLSLVSNFFLCCRVFMWGARSGIEQLPPFPEPSHNAAGLRNHVPSSGRDCVVQFQDANRQKAAPLVVSNSSPLGNPPSKSDFSLLS